MIFVCNTDPEDGFCGMAETGTIATGLVDYERQAIRSGFYVRVECDRHGGWQCYLQLDGSHISRDDCACNDGPLTCPIDFHRTRYLQDTQDWSDHAPDRKTARGHKARGQHRGLRVAQRRPGKCG